MFAVIGSLVIKSAGYPSNVIVVAPTFVTSLQYSYSGTIVPFNSESSIRAHSSSVGLT